MPAINKVHWIKLSVGNHVFSPFTVNNVRPNVLVEWLAFLLRIREVSSLNLGPQTGYPDCVFCGFPQFLQANSGTVP
jgi:hypothetical protein